MAGVLNSTDPRYAYAQRGIYAGLTNIAGNNQQALNFVSSRFGTGQQQLGGGGSSQVTPPRTTIPTDPGRRVSINLPMPEFNRKFPGAKALAPNAMVLHKTLAGA